MFADTTSGYLGPLEGQKLLSEVAQSHFRKMYVCSAYLGLHWRFPGDSRFGKGTQLVQSNRKMFAGTTSGYLGPLEGQKCFSDVAYTTFIKMYVCTLCLGLHWRFPGDSRFGKGT